MRRGLLVLLMLSLSWALGLAQDVASQDDYTFRQVMNGLVRKGNDQYRRSYRPGIKLCADSLEQLLTKRSKAGLLAPDDSVEYAADLLKLRGDWHYENSNYDEASYTIAEKFFHQALALYEGNEHLNELEQAPMIHRELAQLYYKQGRYSEALEHTATAIAAYDDEFSDNEELCVDLMTDKERLDYLDMVGQRAMCLARLGRHTEALHDIDSVVRVYSPGDSTLHEALRKKAKILMLAGGSANEALALYKQYFTWVKEDALATLATMTATEREDYWMRMRPFVADCYQLEGADAAFLYDVTLFAKGLLLQISRFSGRGQSSRQALNSLRYDWRQIQRNLPADGCAIEFVQYEKLGKQLLAALVLRNTGRPRWVAMLSPADFMAHEVNGRTNRERIYSTLGSLKNALYGDSTLSAMIWNAQLIAAIKGCKKVYFAPDGYLHQVAIEYMLPEALARADVLRLTSTRRLMEHRTVRTDAALIVGGVQYNTSTPSGQDRDNDGAAYRYLLSRNVTNFSSLRGSKAETDSIRLMRSCPADTVLTGVEATEKAFSELCGHYPIVTLSTHGFFGAAEVPQGTDVKPCLSDESLSQCVIAMAGANTNLGQTDFDTRRLDGVLSARELSAIDMENVDLVVVSACQTALGYVTADGVYGLQRGLKNAGAKCMLVSLWDVSDDATCLLMSQFHKNLRAGMTAHQAFMAARQSLIIGADAPHVGGGRRVFNRATLTSRRAPARATYEKPMFCDAFILIDATE